MEIVALIMEIQRQAAKTQRESGSECEQDSQQNDKAAGNDEQFSGLLHKTSVRVQTISRRLKK